MKEYVLKFIQLSRYSPTLVADHGAILSKFILGISEMVVKECHTTMLRNNMDVSLLMVQYQQKKDEKLKESPSEVMKCQTRDGDF